ncbi:MAG TPA: acyl-CoA dehydrogenase family protein [Alphaproteobacteria bacterium]|nr:acyl-CoA dehydrogenase family protein [Alphaproteobacteria bacterium]
MRDLRDFRERNAFADDAYLRSVLGRARPHLLDRQGSRLEEFGRWVTAEVDPAAAHSDREAPPRLIEAEGGDPAARLLVNPCYAAAHRQAYRLGMVGLNHGPAPEPFLLTFVMGYLLSQADISIHCPVTLTGAVALVLDRLAPTDLRTRYLKPLTRMDGSAWTGGTWATEREGGSDVGASTTVARATEGGFSLSGLKWFCSNAGSDLALATARPEGAPPGSAGLGLYLVPRIKPDGAPNSYRIRRLKDKLGTRGLPTGEIDLVEAYAEEVAPPPRGFKLMMEALEFSRVHNICAAAGAQRRAFLEALRHAATRTAFGAPILSYPMVQASLLDMQMELEASLLLALAAGDAFDAVWARDRGSNEEGRAWLRLLVAAAKYRTAEQAVRATSSAIELLGGIGYTEEYASARLLRDAQVLPVWEGTANIQALELLRILTAPAEGARLFEKRLRARLEGLPAGLHATAAPVRKAIAELGAKAGAIRSNPGQGPILARSLLEDTADILSAALLLSEAAEALAIGDGRAALVTRRYVGKRFMLDREGPTNTAPIAEPVLFYEPVNPGDT